MPTRTRATVTSLGLVTGAVGLVAATLGAPAGAAPATTAAPSRGASAAGGGAAAPVPTAAYAPTTCWPSIPAEVVTKRRIRCGYVTVPLRHERPSAGSIQLAAAVVPATGPRRRPDPVVLLSGGPGQGAVALAMSFVESWNSSSGYGALNVDRDLVFLDQRGTGYSRPALGCEPYADTTTPDGGLGNCFKALSKKTDLNAFTTTQNSADLDRARRALGYGQVNLYGVSYGSKLGYQTLRGTPSWVRSAALASPIAARPNWVENAPRTYQESLNSVYRSCAAQTSCRRSWGDLKAKLDQVTARLEKKPLVVPISPDRAGRPRSVTVTAESLSTLVFQGLYSSIGVAVTPALIGTLAEGDHTMLSSLLDEPAGDGTAPDPGTLISEGMYMSVVCAEEVAHGTLAGVRAAAKGTQRLVHKHFAGAQIESLWKLCKVWKVERASTAFTKPVASKTPTLVVSGAFDPITPPSYGTAMARSLPRSQKVTLQAYAHSPLEDAAGCANSILEPFVNAPTTRFQAPCASASPHLFTRADLGRPSTSAEKLGQRAQQQRERSFDADPFLHRHLLTD